LLRRGAVRREIENQNLKPPQKFPKAMNVTTATSGKENSKMATFTIDSENNIAAHAVFPANTDNLEAFATEKELSKLTAEWPGPRLVDIWNSLAGVAPFTELKPVKKFRNRRAAAGRIGERRGAGPKERRINPRPRLHGAPGRERAQPRSGATRKRR
jgi:hypothetical protein